MKMKRGTPVIVDRRHHGGKCPFSGGVGLAVLFLIIGRAVEAQSTGCGHPAISQRVVGGGDSQLGKWPWTCSLMYGRTPVCGAALVSNYYAITAAHCLTNRDIARFVLMVGMLNLTNAGPTQRVYAVQAAYAHPLFNNTADSGDVAVLLLQSAVTYTDYIRPICLPSPGQQFPHGMMCTMTGWGYTDDGVRLHPPMTMQEVELPLVHHTVCDRLFYEKFQEYYQGQVHDDMICAGYPDQRKDGCQGDSGGPLSCKVNGTWYLTGIVSWGAGCATPGIVGVYTNVPSFTSWIIEQMSLPSSTRTGSSNTSSTTNVNDTFRLERVTTANPNKVSQSFIGEDTTTADGHTPQMPMTSLVVVALLLAKILEMM